MAAPNVTGTEVVHRSCTLCEALCGLEVEVDRTTNTVLSITGDERDPLSGGYLCPKGTALADLATDPDRLTAPVRRQPDGTFAPIGWDEAFDLVADNITRIQREHGKDAFAAYLGNPSFHNTGTIFLLPLLRLLGTRNRYSATSTDQAPQSLVSTLLYGHQILFPLPDLDRTDHLLVLGANPAVSNGSLVTAPDFKGRIKAIRERGGTVTVVDPRRTETARKADRHVPITPGTDALLLAAMITTIREDGDVHLGRVAHLVDHYVQVLDRLAVFTPERVAGPTGIDADTIREMAREFTDARRSVAYCRVGVCQTRLGSVTAWLVNVLNVITGRLDEVGGAMFATPAVDVFSLVATVLEAGTYDRHRSRVRNLPELNGELPIATLADEITTPGEGQVRGLMLNAGNPVLSAPNGARLDEALRELEFCFAIDFYITESTRHADVILPPTTHLEHDHYDLVFHALAVRNTAKYSPAALEPAPDAKHDHEILLEIASRLGRGPLTAPLARALRLVGKVVDPMTVVAAAILAGPYGLRRGRRALTLAKLKKLEHGVDLGPLEPGRLPNALWTKGKRIDLAPRVLMDAVAEAERLLDPERATAADRTEGRHGFDLRLIGRRHLRSNNSWLHNSERMVKGRDRCTVLVHPDDADARGIADGDEVVVTSRVGKITVPAEVSDEIAPGVVSIPHGWGHDRPGTNWRIANDNPGASVNDLTDHEVLDLLTGNAAFNDVRVALAPA